MFYQYLTLELYGLEYVISIMPHVVTNQITSAVFISCQMAEYLPIVDILDSVNKVTSDTHVEILGLLTLIGLAYETWRKVFEFALCERETRTALSQRVITIIE